MAGGAWDSLSRTSRTLLGRAQAHDPQAWQRLSTLYVPLVYGWARQAGVQSNEATDVVQEVFRSVLANIGRFRYDQPNATFRGWLWTITRNEIRRHFRRIRSRAEVTGGTAHREQLEQYPDLLDEEEEPSTIDQNKSLIHRALRLVRGDFEDKTWEAFWRLTVQGESAAEIAGDLGMNAKSVRQAKYRVLSRLRQELVDNKSLPSNEL